MRQLILYWGYIIEQLIIIQQISFYSSASENRLWQILAYQEILNINVYIFNWTVPANSDGSLRSFVE